MLDHFHITTQSPSERDVRSGTFFPRREGAKGAINFGGCGGGPLSLRHDFLWCSKADIYFLCAASRVILILSPSHSKPVIYTFSSRWHWSPHRSKPQLAIEFLSLLRTWACPSSGDISLQARCQGLWTNVRAEWWTCGSCCPQCPPRQQQSPVCRIFLT